LPRDGSGVYSLPEAAFAANTPAVASKVNSNFSDVATALTASVTRDGSGSMSGNLNMGSNRITAVAAGTAVTDASTVAQVQNSATVYASGGGTANAHTLTLTPAPAAYAAGQAFSFVANATNTGATTLNVNGLGAKNIVRGNGSTALAGGEIQSGALVSVVYDGTSFRMDAPTGWELISKASPSGASTIDITLPSGYAEFEVSYALTPSVDAQLIVRSSTDGTTFPSTGGDYATVYIFNNSTTTSSASSSGTAGGIIVAPPANGSSVMRGTFRINASEAFTVYGATSLVFDEAGSFWTQGTAGGIRNSVTPAVAFRLLGSAGTLTGSVSLRGFR
jgi:hypothetical protein